MRWLSLYIITLLLTRHVNAQQPVEVAQSLLQNQFIAKGQLVFPLGHEVKWEYTEAGTGAWKPAVVPGCIHTDISNQPELYFGDNEKNFRWIEEKNWEYKTTFRVGDVKAYTHFELVFEQLDVYATVFLNNREIMKTDNAFRTWRCDISPFLKTDTSLNHLRVVFESPVKKGRELAAALPYALPGDEKVFTRKAQYEYGWDWGPRFVTSGIRKPVYIVCKSNEAVSINHVQLIQQPYNAASTALNAKLNITAQSDKTVWISRAGGAANEVKKITLKKGENNIGFAFAVADPQQWWPRGYGQSIVYPFTFLVHDKKPGGKKTGVLAEKTVVHAFCTIGLVQEKDTAGTSFGFKVNGIPVFIKGINMIPYDSFEEYRNNQQLDQLYNLNVNMVRVWGGGYYCSNEFYMYCLLNGIMVWQDFMFACAMYPGDDAYLANVKQEITEQVIRLRNFNNIALWCGNNENDEGWHNWGWQKQYKYSPADSSRIWNDYRKLFHELIPNVIGTYDAGRAYWPSSPSIGWGRKQSIEQGDCHYWGVWWGKQPIDTFAHRIPRFMSEYGMQAMPALATLKKNMAPGDFNRESPAFKNHQKHATGFETLDYYLSTHLQKPSGLEQYAYATQVLQAYTLTTAIEAHRKAKPWCMGTMPWQLNDCWPVTSWSLTDHELQPKLAYYEVANAYSTFMTSVNDEPGELSINIVSDSIHDIQDTLTVELRDFNGELLYRKIATVYIKANSSENHIYFKKELLPPFDPGKVFIHTRLHTQKYARAHHLVPLQQLALQEPGIAAFIRRTDESCHTNCQYMLHLKSETYVPYVWCNASGKTGRPIYLPYMLPGVEYTVPVNNSDLDYFTSLARYPAQHFYTLNALLGTQNIPVPAPPVKR